jgi:hypothetical protein
MHEATQELHERARPVLQRLAHAWDEPRVLDLDLAVSGRMVSSLGRAYLESGRVRVAAALVRSRHLEELLAHEAAHLVVHWRHGRVRPHGREWRALLVQAGERARVRLDPLDVVLPPRRRRRRRSRAASAAAFLRSLL